MSSAPAPLKLVPGVSPTPAKQPSPKPSQAALRTTTTKPEDISSPHELTAFVETLLGQLETKFDDMSSQLLDRMAQMSSRVDSLESSIKDLIESDIAAPASPQPSRS
ncbi:hypothetical protein EXIGLDRAFT_633060 [Exidia glandulosa HHB12029]|uniref:Heat shock factor binding protein 1 n=1 Tax=Exidia glandulosa HHB12029 TaxID=1314781 RepID=A0A166N8U7_EXIGL|nr:hypothetical protein EXIGLDRAFT_633060 [Exidia glandulosa HHB12029]